MSGAVREVQSGAAFAGGPTAAADEISSRRAWDGRTRSGLGIRLMYWLFRIFGPLFAYSLLYPIVFYYLVFAGKHRRASRDYLKRVFPLAGTLKLHWLSYRHFLSFGRILLDRAYAFSGNLDSFTFERENTQSFEQALAQGKGLIVVSAHVGNWELAAHGLATLGQTAARVPINLVWFRNESEAQQNHLESVAGNRPYNIIDSRDALQASIEMVAALKRGEIVAIHGDRATGTSVGVPFFGTTAEFPAGPSVVAASTGAPVMFVFANRLGARRYSLKAIGPVFRQHHSRRERDEDLRRWTAEYAQHLEARLRQFPLQWHNFYPFWG